MIIDLIAAWDKEDLLDLKESNDKVARYWPELVIKTLNQHIPFKDVHALFKGFPDILDGYYVGFRGDHLLWKHPTKDLEIRYWYETVSEEEMGRIAGYPKCCTQAFIDGKGYTHPEEKIQFYGYLCCKECTGKSADTLIAEINARRQLATPYPTGDLTELISASARIVAKQHGLEPGIVLSNELPDLFTLINQ